MLKMLTFFFIHTISGNSWKVGSTCGDVTAILPHPCESSPQRKRWAEESCAVIKSGPFVACHSVVCSINTMLH
jgi:hypothetical protein